jgi:hypothetical protein
MCILDYSLRWVGDGRAPMKETTKAFKSCVIVNFTFI